MELEVIKYYRAVLGEGAIWNHMTGELFWIDIDSCKFIIYDPEKNQNRIFKFDRKPGTVVPENDDHAIIALEDGIFRFNMKTESLERIFRNNNIFTRFNDGKCDPQGRFWAGTMDYNCKKPIGILYRMDGDGTVHTVMDKITVSNGITWSPDQVKMHFIDTPTRKVCVYDFDGITGDISHTVDFMIPPEIGMPDGSTIDEEGMLWIALWGGSSVGRWNPHTGKLITKIDIPAVNVTSLAFGGRHLDTLFVTTANISDNAHPLAGYLFSFKPGVKGIKANFFKSIRLDPVS
jgi:sugar lactone lactonase YvrE